MQCNTIGFLLSGSVCFKLSEVINVEAHAAHTWSDGERNHKINNMGRFFFPWFPSFGVLVSNQR